MFQAGRQSSFGVDISDLSIKIIQLQHGKGGPSVRCLLKEKFSSGIVEQGVVKNSKKLAATIEKTIEKACQKGLDKKGGAVCTLPEEKVFIRLIQLPKMKLEEVGESVKWEAESHIPMDIEDVYLSWQEVSPKENHLDHLDILVAATPKSLVRGYLDAFSAAGVELNALEPESLAVSRSLIKEDDFEPVIIVDLGETGTNFVIFAGNAIRFTSQVPISGQVFNQAIEKKVGVSAAEAKELKIKAGLTEKAKKKYKIKIGDRSKADFATRENQKSPYGALLPVVKDLADQLKDYASFYHNQANHLHGVSNSIKKIFLCGGDSLLLGLPEFLSRKLGLPVVLGDPLKDFLPADKKTVRKSAVYTTALGLALRDFR